MALKLWAIQGVKTRFSGGRVHGPRPSWPWLSRASEGRALKAQPGWPSALPGCLETLAHGSHAPLGSLS